MSYKFPEEFAAYDESSVLETGRDALGNLMAFLRIHEVNSHKATGVASAYTHAMLDCNTPGVTTTILYNIPTPRIQHFHSLLAAKKKTIRPYIFEHVAANKCAKLFFDLDFPMDIVNKAKLRSLNAVSVYEQLVDLFTEHVEMCIHQTFAEQSSEDEEQVACNLTIEPVKLRRLYNKLHIIYPTIRCDKKSMHNLATAIIKSLNNVDINNVIRLPPNTTIAVDWKKIVDTAVYKDLKLRMIGCSSATTSSVEKEAKWYRNTFTVEEGDSPNGDDDSDDEDEKTDTKLEGYRKYYTFMEHPDAKFEGNMFAAASIHCLEQREQRANFVMLGKAETERMENQNCELLFKEHMEDVIQRRIKDTLYNLRTTASDVFSNVEIDPTVIECKQLSQNSYVNYTQDVSEILEGDCFAATLAIQQCPFAKRLHNRCLQGRSPLVCLVFSSHILLRCHSCTEKDPSARLVMPIQRRLGEVDMLHQLQMAKDALLMRTDAQLASVIFNWIRDRTAATEVPGRQRQYKYMYFNQDRHMFIAKDEMLVDDIMEPTGLVQTKFAEICKMIGKASGAGEDEEGEEEDDEEGGALADVGKRNSVKKLLLKLNKRLQTATIQSSVIPLIGRKLSNYYQNNDPEMRPFDKQLDQKGWLLCCRNGVIDFREGAKLRPGRPSDLLSVSTNSDYIAWEALDPELKKMVIDLFETIFPIKEERDYALLCYARALNGDRRRQVVYFEYGKGSDGKSVLFRMLKKALGNYYGQLPTSLIFGVDKNGSGPRSDMMYMRNKRICAFMEPNAKDPLNNGVTKGLTGGDDISASEKFEQHTNFTPQATLFVVLNNKAVIEGSALDHGLWRRVAYHLFRHRFVQKKDDISEKEYCSVGMSEDKVSEYVERMSVGVFSYLIHVYQNTMDDAYDEPEALADIARATRAENDLYLRYLNERIEPIKKSHADYVKRREDGIQENDDDPEKLQNGIKVFDLWAPFKDWLKSRGFNNKSITISRFEEMIAPHVKRSYLPEYDDLGFWYKWKDTGKSEKSVKQTAKVILADF